MKAGALEKMLSGGAALARTKALLQARGVEVLAPTNPYEVIRFRSKYGIGVVYRNSKGKLSPSEAASKALAAAHHSVGGSLAPVHISIG